MASNWLNPVQDYLNAAKSGTEAGQALARILNDKQQAAEKLVQADRQQADSNALAYATLGSKEAEATQTAAERQQEAAAKLMAAQAQSDSLNQWRQNSLAEKSKEATANLGYKTNALNDRDYFKQLAADQNAQKIQNQADQAAQKLANSAAWRRSQYGAKMTQPEKSDYDLASSTILAARKALLTGAVGDAYTTATNLIATASAKQDSLQAKYGGVTPSAAGDLTLPTSASTNGSAADALQLPLGISVTSPSSNVELFTSSGASPSDALTTGTATGSLPSASAAPAATKQPVTTQEQYDALNSGDTYIGEDGRTYQKP